MAPPPSLEDLIQDVVTDSPDALPLTRLQTAAALARAINERTDAALGYFVDQARRAGHSWSDIGDSLGVSKQAAQQRQTARAVSVMTPVTFERFTERARTLLVQSQAVARQLGHDQVTPEHLLLAQYGVPEGLAAQILTESGLPARSVRKAIVDAVGRGPGAPDGRLPFTTAMEVFAGALAAALELKHNYIGTEHVLLGTSKTDSVAGRILQEAGLDEASLRARVEARLAGVVAARTASGPAAGGAVPPARRRGAGARRPKPDPRSGEEAGPPVG